MCIRDQCSTRSEQKPVDPGLLSRREWETRGSLPIIRIVGVLGVLRFFDADGNILVAKIIFSSHREPHEIIARSLSAAINEPCTSARRARGDSWRAHCG